MDKTNWIRNRAYDIYTWRSKLGFLPRDPLEDWTEAEFEWEQYNDYIKNTLTECGIIREVI